MNHKKAIITGGASGIGAAYSTALAKKGYDLVIVDRAVDSSKDFFIDQLEKKYSVKVSFVKADLSKNKNIKDLGDYLSKISDVEFLVNCAGFGMNKKFVDGDEGVEESMIFVHDIAPMILTRSVLDSMISNKKGFIVNVSSLGGLIPLPGEVVYASSKSFIKTFSETLSLELSGTGVVVQALAPGFVKTHFHDKLDSSKIRRHKFLKWLTPEDVVLSSLKCLSKKRVICIPNWRYRLLFRTYYLLPRTFYYWLIKKLVKK